MPTIYYSFDLLAWQHFIWAQTSFTYICLDGSFPGSIRSGSVSISWVLTSGICSFCFWNRKCNLSLSWYIHEKVFSFFKLGKKTLSKMFNIKSAHLNLIRVFILIFSSCRLCFVAKINYTAVLDHESQTIFGSSIYCTIHICTVYLW